MNDLIQKKFEQLGTRVRIVPAESRRTRWFRDSGASDRFRVNVLTDKKGEYFEVEAGANVEVSIVDTSLHDRHLLLMAENNKDKSKFLCGHDERHWFVAAIPENSGASDVATAIEALKPREVRIVQARKKVKTKDRKRRKNAAYVRQGEWFFVPLADTVVDETVILLNEPLRRGRGKPHMAEMLVRQGGETVYVNRQFPNGLTESERRRVVAEAKRMGRRVPQFEVRRRDAGVFVKGRIRHPDHKTVHLHEWHRVIPNTETESRAMRDVVFVD